MFATVAAYATVGLLLAVAAGLLFALLAGWYFQAKKLDFMPVERLLNGSVVIIFLIFFLLFVAWFMAKVMGI
jgi:hypothetical protein